MTKRTEKRTLKGMEIINATEARQNLYRLIDQAAQGHEPIFIKGRKNRAVLISEEDWRAVSETLYLAAIPGMRESIAKARQEPLDEAATELEW